MANRQVRFGSVNLPSTFAPAEDSLGFDVQPVKLPRTDGARVVQGYAAEKVVPVRGTLIKGPISNVSPYSDLRAAVDALREQLSGGPANLYFWDDRYYRDVHRRGFSQSFARFDTIANIDIEFVTGDPFAYSVSESSDFWSAPTNGSSKIITPGGNAYALPIYKFDVGVTATINWTFSNNTNTKSFALNGAVTAGQIIEVDTREKTVKIGSTDKMSLFDGQFPELEYTANTMQVTVAAGVIASIRTVWRDRWHG